jgi:phosphate starvation-inducible protein PhoH
MFCGDATQTDLVKQTEKTGIMDFMRIIQAMPSFDVVEFQAEDICRSGLVKEYIMAKLQLGL